MVGGPEVTKEEALKKIKELEAFIKDFDNNAALDNDELFLLSRDEYEQHKEVIPHINHWWWLRTTHDYRKYAETVDSTGDVFESGCATNVNLGGVRPALRIKSDSLVADRYGVRVYKYLSVGDKIGRYGYTWIKISDDLAISEMPIGFEKFDDKSNDYENSYIRKWLKDWLKERC